MTLDRLFPKDHKLELLRRVPLFDDCRGKELAELARIADLLDVPAGMRLLRQGAAAREFMVILDGSADVDRGGATINGLGRGDFFGEIALVSGGARTATVTATTPTTLLVLTERPFWQLLDQNAVIQSSVLEAYRERLATTVDALVATV